MDGRDLVRSMKAVGSAGAAQGLRTVRAAWRRNRADAAGLPVRGPERARVPGAVQEAEPGPGGGTLRFSRSELRIRVAVSGAVFWSWDGAEPEPSYALAGRCPEPDPRAVLEPDKDGGWRVIAERVTVVVSRHGAIDVCTPGGVMLRRELPPRWWEPAEGGPARWMQRSEVAADARFFGLGGRASGPRLRDGTYRLWNTDPGRAFGRGTIRSPSRCRCSWWWPTRAPTWCSTTPPGTARSRCGRARRGRARGTTGPGRARCGWRAVRCAAGWWWAPPRACCSPGSRSPGRPRCRPRGRWVVSSRAGASGARRRCAGPWRAIRSTVCRSMPSTSASATTTSARCSPSTRSASRNWRCSPRNCVGTGYVWCRPSARRSRPRRATPCTTAGWPRTRSCGARRAGSSRRWRRPGRPFSRISRTRACGSGGEVSTRSGSRRASPASGTTWTNRRCSPLSGSRRCPGRRGTPWRDAGVTIARPTTCTGCAWPRRPTRGCGTWFPTSVPSSSRGPAGRACSATAAPGPGSPPRAGRGCGRHCRWCWGWGCAECRIQARTRAVSTAVRRPSCMCVGSSWARTCRCSARTRACGRGSGSRGSSVPRCWSTRVWRSSSVGGCCRTS